MAGFFSYFPLSNGKSMWSAPCHICGCTDLRLRKDEFTLPDVTALAMATGLFMRAPDELLAELKKPVTLYEVMCCKNEKHVGPCCLTAEEAIRQWNSLWLLRKSVIAISAVLTAFIIAIIAVYLRW